MTARIDRILHVAALVGHDVLEIEDVRDGWPALATLHVERMQLRLALFVGSLGSGGRRRDDVERRFQNPGQNRPLVGVDGRASVLLALWDQDDRLRVSRPIIVTYDADRRDGLMTRWSAFAPVSTLMDAQATGWATHVSDSGESIRCMVPALLPAAILADVEEIELEQLLVQTAVEASGLLEEPEGAAVPDSSPSALRARRATYSLVRDARFARRVLDAYDGRCAMCGVGLHLVQGAHIYPASAHGSLDRPWNGLSLCANHHLAFDRYLVAVHPVERYIVFHPDVLEAAQTDPTARAFIEGTLTELRPCAARAVPKPEMFHRRYAHYFDEYEWLPANFSF
ncbi:HNH endonuclease [Modestobacter sp. VKM Ac-2977]|uniref:HNH endonuclease n=1 Tax=Modestobacter sp. VKM Ac-2977 TaxID=3004131 RepID=UPI0022AA2E2E|nr:HNH endonuclease [Modestobacter sp. VKM Ac-2977]MCZ2821054.1 HNH endonuclease [Modestobacter sp. VKM Ac-2977]